MKKLACVTLSVLLVTLICLSLCGCKQPQAVAAELAYTPTVTQNFADNTPTGSLDLTKAPFVLDQGNMLQNKRLTKIEFASTNVQKGQQFSLFVYTGESFTASKTTVTLGENFSQQDGVVSVDLKDVVVWVGANSTIAFFDKTDTIEVSTWGQSNATSVDDGSKASLPIALFTHDYGKHNLALSVLGDSISTFDGVSNNSNDNATLALNKTFYPRYDIQSAEQTWWNVVNQMTGGCLLVNNSWSGSLVTTQTGRAWQKRCVNLHNDKTNQTPDAIAFYMGTNDLGKVDVGEFNKLDDIYNEDTGYISPQTFAQAYAVCIHKMKVAYPNAKIFAFTLPESSYSVDNAVLDEFNQAIVDIANYFDCYIVDLGQMDGYHYTTHTDDNLHPNVQGMLCIADYFARCIQATSN